MLALPPGLPASALIEAGNYLNARMKGRTLAEARKTVLDEVALAQALLDQTAAKLIEDGLAQWSGEDPARGRSLIVRGRANLLDDPAAADDLNRVRDLSRSWKSRKTCSTCWTPRGMRTGYGCSSARKTRCFRSAAPR